MVLLVPSELNPPWLLGAGMSALPRQMGRTPEWEAGTLTRGTPGSFRCNAHGQSAHTWSAAALPALTRSQGVFHSLLQHLSARRALGTHDCIPAYALMSWDAQAGATTSPSGRLVTHGLRESFSPG